MSVTNINIPTAQSFILVDTRTGPNKVLFLPTASTIQGRYLSIKDYYGNANSSTLTISTTGLDRIDQSGSSYTLASSFGTVMLLSDGLRSWNMMGLYEGSDTATGIMAVVVSTFTPLTITGIQLWFDGADPAGTGTLPSNGAVLSTWADKSGNSKNATGVNSPTYVLSSKSVSFVRASSQYFNLPDACLPYNNSSYSYFIIFSVDSSSSGLGYIGGGNYGNSGQVCAIRQGDGGLGTIRQYWWGNDLDSTAAYTTNQVVLLGAFYASGGARSTWINGTQVASDTPGTRSQGSGNNKIGQTYSGEYMSGTISEVIVYNTSVGTTDRQKLEGYLAWKWGIQASLPSDHPYKSAAPTS